MELCCMHGTECGYCMPLRPQLKAPLGLQLLGNSLSATPGAGKGDMREFENFRGEFVSEPIAGCCITL